MQPPQTTPHTPAPRPRAGPLSPYSIADDLTRRDLAAALAAGWRDFTAAPQFGLFFAAFYVAGGLVLSAGMAEMGQGWWVMAVMAGFPLFAPFAAVGLYEVSRRRESGLPLRWGGVLAALKSKGDEQLPLMGGIIFVAFSFWMILAHGIFAIFMAESGVGGEALARWLTFDAIAMLVVGSIVGALFALALFAITVISLPMLVDREVDFITAIIVSLAVVRANGAVLLGWAVIIAASLAIAMLPLFLGLFIALPVLGHATWHLYRRAVTAKAVDAG